MYAHCYCLSYCHLTDCETGFYGRNCSSPCRYPNYGKDCQQDCSHCNLDECNSTLGCMSSDVPTSQGIEKTLITSNVIFKHISYARFI